MIRSDIKPYAGGQTGELKLLPQVHNPGWSTLFQILQEKVRHVERRKMVNAHGDFEVFLCPIIRRYENASVVDQNVQRRTTVKKLV